MENATDIALPRDENGLAVERETINILYRCRTYKKRILTILNFILVVTTACFYISQITQPLHHPLPAKPW
ncbi:hypothetical protein D3C84_1213130 [compost metagenome]